MRKTKRSRTKHMNNFYTKLPGGYYRSRAGKRDKERGLFGEIDRLLVDEFSDLPVAEILAAINAAEDITCDALNQHFTSVKEFDKFVGSIPRKGRAAYRRLQPLFDRLVELGFDPEFLRQ